MIVGLEWEFEEMSRIVPFRLYKLLSNLSWVAVMKKVERDVR